jgi:hypothetical protein
MRNSAMAALSTRRELCAKGLPLRVAAVALTFRPLLFGFRSAVGRKRFPDVHDLAEGSVRLPANKAFVAFIWLDELALIGFS